MVEVSLTVGKLDASLALLLTKDHHLIEFPTILLPNGVKAGSIVKIKCDQDLETEQEDARQFQKIQDEILNTFGKNLPKNPVLKVKNVTQTSCVLEWDSLELGTANLKNLILFKDGKKLGAIPQPLTNKTTKLSGLPIDKTFQFQLRLDTTAGVYSSEIIEVTTHKMTNLSGITVCLGDITPNDQFTVEDVEETLKNMGANYPPQDKVKVDTTHFICTRENKQNPEFMKANDMNIPIIRPEWLKACERERRIVGVRDFYVKDCVLPDIFAKNYWQKNEHLTHKLETLEEVKIENPTEKDNGQSESTTKPENEEPLPEDKIDHKPAKLPEERLQPELNEQIKEDVKEENEEREKLDTVENSETEANKQSQEVANGESKESDNNKSKETISAVSNEVSDTLAESNKDTTSSPNEAFQDIELAETEKSENEISTTIDETSAKAESALIEETREAEPDITKETGSEALVTPVSSSGKAVSEEAIEESGHDTNNGENEENDEDYDADDADNADEDASTTETEPNASTEAASPGRKNKKKKNKNKKKKNKN